MGIQKWAHDMSTHESNHTKQGQMLREWKAGGMDILTRMLSRFYISKI